MSAAKPIDLDAMERALAECTPRPWSTSGAGELGEITVRGPDDEMLAQGSGDGCEVLTYQRPAADARAIVAAVNAAPQLVALARAVVAYASAYSRWDEAERRAACASERKYPKALDAAMEANATAQKARAALLTLAAGLTTTTRDRANGEE
jgi:hypothetical protein